MKPMLQGYNIFSAICCVCTSWPSFHLIIVWCFDYQSLLSFHGLSQFSSVAIEYSQNTRHQPKGYGNHTNSIVHFIIRSW